MFKKWNKLSTQLDRLHNKPGDTNDTDYLDTKTDSPRGSYTYGHKEDQIDYLDSQKQCLDPIK